jgi:hypothetical protein
MQVRALYAKRPELSHNDAEVLFSTPLDDKLLEQTNELQHWYKVTKATVLQAAQHELTRTKSKKRDIRHWLNRLPTAPRRDSSTEKPP